MTSFDGEMKANFAVNGTSSHPSCILAAASTPNRLVTTGSSAVSQTGMPAASARTINPSTPTAMEIAQGTATALSPLAPEQSDPEDFDVGGEGYGRRQGESGSGKSGHEAAAEVCEVEALEEGLEEIPFADEASLWRHSRQAHGGEQRAEAEDPRAVRQDPALDQLVAGGGAVNAVSRQKHRPLGERVGG